MKATLNVMRTSTLRQKNISQDVQGWTGTYRELLRLLSKAVSVETKVFVSNANSMVQMMPTVTLAVGDVRLCSWCSSVSSTLGSGVSAGPDRSNLRNKGGCEDNRAGACSAAPSCFPYAASGTKPEKCEDFSGSINYLYTS